MRVIGDNGENFGVLKISEAIEKAKKLGLDLIEIAPTAIPPVAKIMDYGKFQYQKQKKHKGPKTQVTETKGVRMGLGTSQHDLELKAKKISEFLKEGHRIRIELILRGRAKYIDKNFIQERIDRLLRLISEPHKISGAPMKGPRGIILTIEKTK